MHVSHGRLRGFALAILFRIPFKDWLGRNVGVQNIIIHANLGALNPDVTALPLSSINAVCIRIRMRTRYCV